MAAENVKQEFLGRLARLGKAGMNAAFPDEFEFYLIAFELIDSSGNTVDYFAFPVLPDAVKESQPELNNIKKTAGGVVVLDNDTFIPTDITLNGTFGRTFKFLINRNPISFAGFRFQPGNTSFNFEKPEFSSFAKTGYGCIKVMESIKKKSRQLDKNGKPHRLIFYNSILGNNYLVKFIDFEHSQDTDQSNMMPKYNIVLKSIGTLGNERGGFLDLAANLAKNIVQKGINNDFSRVKRAFRL